MDPDANLAEQMKLASSIIAMIDEYADEYGAIPDDIKDAIVDDANRLAELVQALGGWVSRGGFLPAAYRR